MTKRPLGRLFLIAVAPEVGHVFEGLALGFGDEGGDEPCGDDADDAVERVGKHVAELVAHAETVHVIHRNEGRRDDEVENPLESHRDGHCLRTDGIWEDLGDEHPADRAP